MFNDIPNFSGDLLKYPYSIYSTMTILINMRCFAMLNFKSGFESSQERGVGNINCGLPSGNLT